MNRDTLRTTAQSGLHRVPVYVFQLLHKHIMAVQVNTEWVTLPQLVFPVFSANFKFLRHMGCFILKSDFICCAVTS